MVVRKKKKMVADMEKLVIGDKVIVNGLKGVIIESPRYQRKIMISFGSKYGVWMIPRRAVRKENG